MSDRGTIEPVKSPKYIDLTAGERKVLTSARAAAPRIRAPEGTTAPQHATPPRTMFRSLDELAGTPEFKGMLDREFPQAASEWDDSVSRRNFIKLMGASLALAGLATGCAQKPEEKILPYVQQPEHVVPGRPLFFASTMPWGGFGKGVLVEQHEGRPTKIEGNEQHPASLGAADIWGQASILGLYDPDRSQAITRFGNISSWGSFLESLQGALTFEDWNGAKATRRSKPARVRILTETTTSPTFKAAVESARASVGGSLDWHTYDSVGRDNTRAGAKAAFGADVTPVYNFAAAATIVSLDCNFLTDDPGSLRYARDYMDSRRSRSQSAHPRHEPGNRLYVVESAPTVAGAMADHCVRRKPELVHQFAAALYQAVKEKKSEGATFAGVAWFGGLVKELLANKGKGLVVAGEHAPVEVHLLAHAINAELDNIGKSTDDFSVKAPHEREFEGVPVLLADGDHHHHHGPDHVHEGPEGRGKPVALIPTPEANPVNGPESIAALVGAIKAGGVDVLLIVGGNPVYNAPADVDFENTLKSVYDAGNKGKFFVAHLGLYEDETARLCEWHLPEAHWLEQWGDLLAYNGAASIVQPLIAPLYQQCKSPLELLANLAERSSSVTGAATRPANAGPAAGTTSPYEMVRDVWREWHKENGQGEFEAFWAKSLHDGLVPRSIYAPKEVKFSADEAKLAEALKVPQSAGLTLMLRPDPNVWDGSLANNAWLQELPRPLTKITWDNALLIHPKTAMAPELGFTSTETGSTFATNFSEAQGKTVNITVGGKVVLTGVPVWVTPGHPEGCATLYMGYGRKFAGRVGSPVDGHVGFDVSPIRTTTTRWNVGGMSVASAGGKYPLAITQNHQVINQETNHKRELVISGYSVPGVADTFQHEMDEKFGVPSDGHTEWKYDALDNDKRARKIGLPILPDDAGTSPVGMFSANPDHGNVRDNNYAAWGMVIDQTACIGCNACVMACQAENNIPVVGKEQVINEREMHWLRIDTYYVGGYDETTDPHGHSKTVNIAEPKATYFQPLPCMQCEKAPCELVCPVGATVHSKEGLNDMAYNRCVGTRYCSNNCPYKVRRFNFLKYNDDTTPVLKLLRNPEVSVRSRGVMEKCTYCVQRISKGRIEAKKLEVEALRSGKSNEEALKVFNGVLDEIQTACQQSCPTEAIVFGNMADPESEIARLKREPIGFHYGLLAELNTRPRTTYFARLENPQKEFRKKEDHHGHAH